MTRKILFLSAAFFAASGAIAQQRSYHFDVKVFTDHSVSWGSSRPETVFDTLSQGHFRYDLAPTMGLAFHTRRSGFGFFLHGISKRTTTGEMLYRDSTGKVSQLEMQKQAFRFSYSLEYTHEFGLEKCKSTRVFLAAGMRHDMTRVNSKGMQNEELLWTKNHAVSFYLAPKVQYAFSQHFFAEASLPFTLVSHQYVSHAQRMGTVPQREESLSTGITDVKISGVMLRCGVGYRF